MDLMDSISHFLENSFGYIGSSTLMPERSCKERIGGIVGLGVLTLMSFGLFFAWETYNYFHSKDVKANPSHPSTEMTNYTYQQIFPKGDDEI